MPVEEEWVIMPVEEEEDDDDDEEEEEGEGGEEGEKDGEEEAKLPSTMHFTQIHVTETCSQPAESKFFTAH
jgi:hypothetical protein